MRPFTIYTTPQNAISRSEKRQERTAIVKAESRQRTEKSILENDRPKIMADSMNIREITFAKPIQTLCISWTILFLWTMSKFFRNNFFLSSFMFPAFQIAVCFLTATVLSSSTAVRALIKDVWTFMFSVIASIILCCSSSHSNFKSTTNDTANIPSLLSSAVSLIESMRSLIPSVFALHPWWTHLFSVPFLQVWCIEFPGLPTCLPLCLLFLAFFEWLENKG